jgi:hypothetical protein
MKNKEIITFAFFLFCSHIIIYAQNLSELKKEYNKEELKKINFDSIRPLGESAFRYMLKDFFTYTIVGEQPMTSGVKVETTSPKLSVNGVFKLGNNNLLTSSLTAGAHNSIGEIFSNSATSNFISTDIGFNILCNSNSATYNDPSSKQNVNPYILLEKRLLSAKHYDKLVESSKEEIIYSALLDISIFKDPTEKVFLEQVNKLAKRAKITDLTDESALVIARNIVKPIAGDNENFNNLLKVYAAIWKDKGLINDKKNVFINKRDSLINVRKKAVETLFQSDIKRVENYWISETINWLTFKPSFEYADFKLLDRTTNSFNSSNSTAFNLSISYSLLKKYRQSKKYIYVFGGAKGGLVNNLEDLEKYTYKNTYQLKIPSVTDPTQSESFTREEQGTGYDGNFKTGFGLGFFIESYFIFAENFPGIYVKGTYSNSEIWTSEKKFSPEVGLILNVSNRSGKPTNRISILPYIAWRNLLKEYKNQDKTDTYAKHELFSAGVKIGLPINVGQ